MRRADGKVLTVAAAQNIRPSGHIMPDHSGDRGAVFLVLAPHDHLHINQLRMFRIERLLAYPQLADLLAERHKIIGNNWRNACTAQLIARFLRRAVAVMEQVDFSPTALRKDLAGARTAPGYLYSAAELIGHAADLSAASSVLTHEDERRWRIFHERIEQITAPG